MRDIRCCPTIFVFVRLPRALQRDALRPDDQPSRDGALRPISPDFTVASRRSADKEGAARTVRIRSPHALPTPGHPRRRASGQNQRTGCEIWRGCVNDGPAEYPYGRPGNRSPASALHHSAHQFWRPKKPTPRRRGEPVARRLASKARISCRHDRLGPAVT